ncbi:diguanylate cyclase [Paenibacillus sp. GD4]|uniref:GGDEF domain-containing protein n=1 Tax=Paenibacillus sp. GD4 TaxID=3068890 RepID=UPI0027965A09|nr:diguanylate cyclase [Paenibacillus sp. GD4]MDQ1911335.1 diguanylate cyclase [Paenibacillus sp. GD4]
MLKDFITNASLLIASLLIIVYSFKRWPVREQTGLALRAVAGILFGLQGILLMVYSIRITETVIIDLRHIPVLLAALYGGWPAAVISVLIVVIGRMGLYGITFSSLASGAGMLLVAALCMLFAGRRGVSLTRFLWLLIMSESILSVVIWSGLQRTGATSILPSIIGAHWAASLSVGLLTAYVFRSMIRANEFSRILQESEENYRKLIENSPDATFVHNEKEILFVNDKGLRLLDAASPKEVLGRSVYDFIHPSHQKEARRQWRLILQKNGALRLDQKYLTLSGKELDVEVSVSPIKYNEESAYLAIFRDITERKQTERKLQEAMDALQKLSDLDGLTGIPNRRRFDRFLAEVWLAAAERSQHLSLVFFDVDYFKLYNDTYGHQVGDVALRNIASVIRDMMEGTAHLPARYGGEEFAVILPNTRIQVAKETAERIRGRIEQLHMAHTASKIADHVTVSLGVASLIPGAGMPQEVLLQMADRALYQAKMEGRNRVMVYHTTEG